jgi:hypothetical protein
VTEAMALLIEILRDPRVGVPMVLTLVSVLVWIAARPTSLPRTSGWEPPPHTPDRDPYSRTYVAVFREEYSRVINEVYERLDRALRSRTGRSLRQIPWRRARAQQLLIPDPRGLERTRQSLDLLELWAFRLETGSWLRRDFWRGPESSRRHLLARLELLLTSIARQLSTLESPA